jgi:hypothetical protein
MLKRDILAYIRERKEGERHTTMGLRIREYGKW